MTDAGHAHEFSFWVGEWDVFDPDGEQVGTNQVTALFDGQVLCERWVGSSGVEGISLNSWDADRGAWHQTWMDSTGSTLLLDGGVRDGAMVLEGDSPAGSAAGVQRHRITWSPSAGGDQVRQFWEVSPDDGTTWETAFDGRYRRR
ncbi:hypothetical protein [Angustibacter luteus]|uniref:DUF1579 domain-containing protein n=1 Tax=Angustibacter luteus TaxID=658456 RepID=A0ABW1JG46_9ACTN